MVRDMWAGKEAAAPPCSHNDEVNGESVKWWELRLTQQEDTEK